MAMPESSLSVVRIGILVARGMVANVIGPPLEGGILERPSSGDQEYGLDPIGTQETPVRNQPMIANRNAEPGNHVQDSKHGPVQPGIPIDKGESGHPDECAPHNKGEQ